MTDRTAARQITVLSLQQQHTKLKKELGEWVSNPRSANNPGGIWMSPADIDINTRVIESLAIVIKYFGEYAVA